MASFIKIWFVKGAASFAIAASCVMLGACTEHVIRQGHLFEEQDLTQVKEGMGKDQVILALGTPDTQSTLNGGASFYYVSTTETQRFAFQTPEIKDRRVVAVYFDRKDKVQKIASYGLKDGVIFDFIKKETPTYVRDQGLLKGLFRDLDVGAAIPGMNKPSQ